jgi:hypothetical protein
MSDILIIRYKHQHECSRREEEVNIHPECRDGVAFLVRPFCIEAGVELVEIARQAVGA